MTNGALRVTLRYTSWLLLAAALAAGTAEAEWEQFESARLGVAPSSYRGMKFSGGIANRHEDGACSAEFKYKSADRRSRHSGSIYASWVERAQAGKTQRRVQPQISFGGSSDGTFSLTRQVNVRFFVSRSPDFPDLRPLAERIVKSLEPRALPRSRYMAAFRPAAKTGRYYLRSSIDYGFKERSGNAYSEFIYSVPTSDAHGRRPTENWRVKIEVHWHEKPATDPRDVRHWDMSEAEHKSLERMGSRAPLLLYSDTHKAYVWARGEYYDGSPRGSVNGFQNEQHRAEAHELAMRFLDVAEKQFAERKVPVPEPKPEVEQPHIQAIDVFDANPLFTGGMPVRDISSPTELFRTVKERRVGVCADGVSEVVLRVEVEKPGRVALELEGGAGTLTMLFRGKTVPEPRTDDDEAERHYAFAHYTPPIEFPKTADRIRGDDPRIGGVVAYRDVPITAKYDPTVQDAETVEETYRLKIVRPPLLLVHGTFDNPASCWQARAPETDTQHGRKSMFDALTAVGFAPFLVDFERTNGSTRGDPGQSSFGHNRRVLWANRGGIYDVLRVFREELDIATTQVDVVGHSLGGLIPRLWASDGYNPRGSGGGVRFSRDGTIGYRRVDNFEAGDIHRLITLCTPHLGSDLGHLALVFRSLPKPMWKEVTGVATIERVALFLADLFGYAVTDVVLDQLPHLKMMPNEALMRIGATEVPSRAIVGWARPPDMQAFGGSYRKGLLIGLKWLLNASGDVVKEFLRVRGQEHDLGRIQGEAFTFEATHFDAGREVIDPWVASLSISDTALLQNLLRAAIFGNTQNDMVVRVESQVGGLPIKFATQIPGVLHSYATMYDKVQREVVKLLDGPQSDFHQPGFPAPSFMRNVEPFTVQQNAAARAQAIATSGYVRSHAEALSFIAMQENVVILARPVNLNSTALIAANNATKDMHVKGKSASWGPQKGYIAVEQRFSKLHFAKKDREKDIKKFDAEVESCLAARRAQQVPLVRDVGGVRCEVLVVKGIQDPEKAIVLKDTASGAYHGWKNAALATFDARSAPGPLEIDAAEISRRGTRPMMILADRNSGIPLTADYDMLAFASQTEPRPPLDDPEMGGIRPYQVELVRKMNNEVRVRANYVGGDVTHHGPENLYGKSPGPDYPITVFEPSGYIITIREGREGRSDYWLKRYYHHLKAREWFILANPAWRWGRYDPVEWPGIGYFPDDRPKPKETSDNYFDSDQGDEQPLALPAAGGGQR